MADSIDDVARASLGAGPDAFEVSVDWQQRTVILAVAGTVDLVTAPLLSESIGSALANNPSAVIVDLTKVEFFASAGMTVLVSAHEQVSPTARFGVVADGPATARPMTLVGVDQIVTIYSSIEAALDDLAE